VGGLDGCRAGWVLAVWGPGRFEVAVVPEFAAVAARVRDGELAALAVDMPIGLPDDQDRSADHQARRRLGARRSSVFPTPIRATLAARDYAEALAISRRVCGRGLSRQAFNLLARTAEVDREVHPRDQDRIFECHPELAFAQLRGHPLVHSKHTPAGIDERVAVLAGVLGPEATAALVDLLGQRRVGAAADDVVDAVVIAWVAAGVAADDPGVEHLGDGGRDRRGLRMEIVTRSTLGSREVPCND
jgi:predicted RNase H-like nuclease